MFRVRDLVNPTTTTTTTTLLLLLRTCGCEASSLSELPGDCGRGQEEEEEVVNPEGPEVGSGEERRRGGLGLGLGLGAGGG